MKRNKFSLSHYKLLTCNMGNLIPISWYEAIPGDTIQQSSSMLIRLSPLLSPVMHPVIIRCHTFFVPNRLIWDDWEDFITGGEGGTSTFTHPFVRYASVAEGSLADYLGIRPDASYSPNLDANALPLRAYQTIYNEHYRDSDIISPITVDTTSGQDTTTNGNIRSVAWEKDYYTTCRTDTSLGSAVTVPLTGYAPVKGIGKEDATYGASGPNVYESDGTTPSYTYHTSVDGTSGGNAFRVESADNTKPFIRTDFDATVANTAHININELRTSMALQKFQEARMQYGSRYVEYLRYLGVRSSDARLQNPEYLGGGRQIMSFSEVLSTDGSNTGDLKGHGIAALKTRRFRRFFEEHGIVMTLLSVLPKAMYADAHPRPFMREVKEDYFTKELQFIGEQEVTNQEVRADHATGTGTFGYQSRYDEYRSGPISQIAGEFRSTLDHWHYARIFASDPALNSSFISSTPTKRVNASSGTDCLYIMANQSVQARRPISPKGTPRLIG